MGRRHVIGALAALAVAVLVGGLLYLAVDGLQPLRVLPASAPPTEFSAIRAIELDRILLGPGAAHPTGSPENAAVRQRIVARLAQLMLAARFARNDGA